MVGTPASAALEEAARRLEGSVEGKVAVGKMIGPLTSFRLGGPAALFVEPVSEADLELAGSVAHESAIPTMIIGKGSNMLVADRGYPGMVIRMGKGFDWIRAGRDPEQVEAGGGAAMPQVSNWAAKRSLAGMEFAVAIPATVGGAVAMNAGAHGSSVSDVLASVRICSLAEGRTDEVAAGDLDMAYRRTSLGPDQLICSAAFRLEPGDPEAIREQMKRNRSHRSATQPSEAPNAGSMFKNPPGDLAGRLIEQAGLKGARVGGAEVSTKHGNFFLALPGATAQDVYDLMATVQARVESEFGIRLLPEVKLVGDFDLTAGLETV